MIRNWTILVTVLVFAILVGGLLLSQRTPNQTQIRIDQGQQITPSPTPTREEPEEKEEQGQDILVSSPVKNEKISSPLQIEGSAKGTWFFEANFSAELFDSANKRLGTAILTAKGDWMTEDFVPFEGELIFQKPASGSGVLRFLSANPSGLPENQKTFNLPIQF